MSAAISNGQLWIMALVMVTDLVWHDPSNDTLRWARVSGIKRATADDGIIGGLGVILVVISIIQWLVMYDAMLGVA